MKWIIKTQINFSVQRLHHQNIADLGINLWMGKSTISSKGTAKLLAGFGVKYFETQEPSDLEYDPQLSVVAEWRDLETLLQRSR
ncbi:MAG: hypothetical protein MZV64_08560 [Ignavibacteriales bacterium]|nr:hypothetical protein [Ignavibacteriales bacterium]